MAKKILPSFNAEPIVTALITYDKTTAAATEAMNATVTTTIQQFLDACAMAGVARNEEGVEWLKEEIRTSQGALDAIAIGLVERKTFTEYANGAGRAYYWNVAYYPDLKNVPEYKLPWTKGGKAGKSASAGKAGKVESTDRSALDATASKFLKQARMLGLNELAADVLDVLLERLEGFKESE